MLIFFKQLFFHYILNHVINNIPFYCVRNIYYKLCSINLGHKSTIHLKTFIEGVYFSKKRLQIGDYTSIGRGSYLDARGGIKIGDSVSISPGVQIITGHHDMNDIKFKYISSKVIIEDYVWIGTNAIILPGVKLGKGSVVGAGAVVTKNVDPFTVVGGVPAKPLKKRNNILDYKCKYDIYFD